MSILGEVITNKWDKNQARLENSIKINKCIQSDNRFGWVQNETQITVFLETNNSNRTNLY